MFGFFTLLGYKKHTFFGRFFDMMGKFGVPIIFLGFWVEPANSVG
jgi:hypothetical protein